MSRIPWVNQPIIRFWYSIYCTCSTTNICLVILSQLVIRDINSFVLEFTRFATFYWMTLPSLGTVSIFVFFFIRAQIWSFKATSAWKYLREKSTVFLPNFFCVNFIFYLFKQRTLMVEITQGDMYSKAQFFVTRIIWSCTHQKMISSRLIEITANYWNFVTQSFNQRCKSVQYYSRIAGPIHVESSLICRQLVIWMT